MNSDPITNSTQNKLKISIITVCYNSQETIAQCLYSIQRQNYPHIEHIIVDGKSTDATIELIGRYRISNSIVISEADTGVYDAMNKGVKIASGDIIGFLNGDDFYADENVLSDIARLLEDPVVDAVYSNLDYVNRTNTNKIVRRWRDSEYRSNKISYGWMPAHPTFYVRRHWYEKVGSFDSSYQISGDYHFLLKICMHPDFNPHFLNRVTVKMRNGGISNKSFMMLLKKSREDWDALRNCDKSIMQTATALCFKNLNKFSQFLATK